MGLGNILKVSLVNGSKLGVVGGAVYLTAQQGIWGGSKEGQEAYHKLRANKLELSPELVDLKKNLPEIPVEIPEISLPELPSEVTDTISSVKGSVSDVNKNFYNYWNSGVESTCSAIIEGPGQLRSLATEKITELTK